ncbi:hypothetical protein KIW84_011766 [Lathyrus oleraceus]|uniref:Uncharacterized protein n=1 Tax=Pisum sativum TaxID=3888 RepID=A0A9D5GV73_PEA|nr:hypothetical protein KIW84_011766 [Pisum sativum]
MEPSVAVKKPHYMTSLYLDLIKTTNVELDVVASIKGSDSGTVSLDNPRSDKTLGYSMNVDDKNIVDKSIYVLISQILGIESSSDVMSDVTTSLAQIDHPTETPPDKSDGKYDNESVPVKSLEKSEEKDDSGSMSVDISDKEDNVGAKKDQYTSIVNVEDVDSDDEPIASCGEVFCNNHGSFLLAFADKVL